MAPTSFGSITSFPKEEYYHSRCAITNFNDQWQVENCWLSGLPDLKQEHDFVRTSLLSWIAWFVQEYRIDGLRIDTIPEVPKWFWSQFTSAAGCYAVGEAFNGNLDYVAGYQSSMVGGGVFQ